MTRIAIIGTAGRDKTKPMTLALWHWMLSEATKKIPQGAHLVSGGAAWADHVAVQLYLDGHASKLTLHLPAPLVDHRFVGPSQSAASAANYYHELFSRVVDYDTRAQITAAARTPNCDGSYEPAAPGYGAMFARNAKVAAVEGMLAFTFGTGDEPADGGTKDTWNKCRGERIHVSLPINL